MTGWARIPREQTPGHGLALPVWVLAARVAAGAVVSAGVVALAIVLWPLASPGVGAAGASDEEPVDRVGALAGQPVESSPESVARLGESFLFTPGRTQRRFEVGEQEAAPIEVVTEGQPDLTEPVGSDDRSDTVQVLRIESPEAVGGEVQQSFQQLVLRAIHSDRTGALIALIDFTGSSAGEASLRLRTGDTFTEPKHTDGDWNVVAIDPERNRVVLERERRRLALALFGTGPADLSPVVIAPAGAATEDTPTVTVADDGTVIVQRSPGDAIAELRSVVGAGRGDEQPITLDDLAELLRLFGDLERYADRAEEEQRERDR